MVMKITERYIYNKIIKNAMIVYGVLIGLLFVIQIIRMLKFIPTSSINFFHIFYFGSLLLSNSIVAVHGVASCIILYATYIALIQNSEMVIFRAIGYNDFTIIKSAIRFLGYTMLVMLCFTMFIVPSSHKKFDKLIQNVREEYLLSALKADRLTNFKNLGIYYKDFEDGMMSDFSVIRTVKNNDNMDTIFSLYAKNANIVPDPDGSIIELYDTQISDITIDGNGKIDNKTSTSQISRLRVNQLLEKRSNAYNNDQYYRMGIFELLKKYKNKDAKKEICSRILIPYYAFCAGISMVLCLIEIKSHRSRNAKYYIMSVISSGLCIIFSFTLVKFVLRDPTFVKFLTLLIIPTIIIYISYQYLKKQG